MPFVWVTLLLGLTAALGLTPAGRAAAAPETVSFSGSVTSATGIFANQGSAVSGSVVYDRTLTEVNP